MAHRAHRRLLLTSLVLAVLLLGSGCGGTPTAAGATATPVKTTPTIVGGPVPCNGTVTTPTTAVKAPLDQGYDTSHATFNPAKVGGLTPGLVTAWWFMGKGGTYVVWFAGLCSATVPVCPGASIKVGSGYQDISNSPTASGGCAGDTKYLAAAPAARICNLAFVFYVTTIPDTATGTLYASVEKGQPDGTTIVGLTSSIATSPTTPTIDLTTLSCVTPT